MRTLRALLGVFPTDIASSIAGGLHVARDDDARWQVLPFIGDWMNQNAWVISEIVLVFAVLTINSLVSG